MGIAAFYIHLLCHQKINAVILLAKAGNYLFSTRFLAPELIAGKTDNHQALLAQFFVQFLQTFVLRRETTLAGRVHNQQNLALKIREAQRLTVEGFA